MSQCSLQHTWSVSTTQTTFRDTQISLVSWSWLSKRGTMWDPVGSTESSRTGKTIVNRNPKFQISSNSYTHGYTQLHIRSIYLCLPPCYHTVPSLKLSTTPDRAGRDDSQYRDLALLQPHLRTLSTTHPFLTRMYACSSPRG